MIMDEAAASRFSEKFRFCAKLNSGNREHEAAEFFDCKFYPFTKPGVDPVLAVVGKQEAIVCRISDEGKGRLDVLAWFHDDDERTELNSCCWALAPETGDPLLCVSGSSRREFSEKGETKSYSVALSIRVFDVKAKTLRQTLVGHGKEIEDLAVLPTNSSILASASMDLTVRLWSLKREHRDQACVLICAGDGHREGLLTLAFHATGKYLLTGGVDHTVRLWHIPDLDQEMPTDHPKSVHYPHFSTTGVHHDYVDCIAWYGDLILSRAANECKIVLWRIEGLEPDKDPPARAPTDASSRSTTSAFGGGYQRLLQFRTPETKSFYMRFGLFQTPGLRPMLVMGNTPGHIFMFDLRELEEWEGSVEATSARGTDGGEAAAPHRKDARSKRGGRGKHAGKKLEDDIPDGLAAAAEDRWRTAAAKKFSVDDPFRLLECHKELKPKGASLVSHIRQVAGSVGGEWMVVIGSNGGKGALAVYGR